MPWSALCREQTTRQRKAETWVSLGREPARRRAVPTPGVCCRILRFKREGFRSNCTLSEPVAAPARSWGKQPRRQASVCPALERQACWGGPSAVSPVSWAQLLLCAESPRAECKPALQSLTAISWHHSMHPLSFRCRKPLRDPCCSPCSLWDKRILPQGAVCAAVGLRGLLLPGLT